jgi:preprotein translocase subunit SecG
MMETLIEIVHIGVAFFMVLVVLVQGGNQGGVGAAFGGGNSSGVFGATGATTLLGKLTYGAAFVFMLTSITLTVMQGRGGDVGLTDRLSDGPATAPVTTPAETAPATTPAPVEAPAPAADGNK